MHNLARYISIIKVKELEWRTTHPYVFADRFELIHDAEDEEKMQVAFYGYVRGTKLSEKSLVHLNGVGDYTISKLTSMDDPVPILDTRAD